MTAAAPKVRASERGPLTDWLETVFGSPKSTAPPAPESAAKAPRRYASLPDPKTVAGPRLVQRTPRLAAHPLRLRERATVSSQALSAGTRTVCVRLCDGYVFPLGQLHARADLTVHAAACAAACPNAATDLYTLAPGRSELQQAVGLDGRPYLRARYANLYRRKRIENCSCQPADGAASPLSPAHDRTLRPGDVIATEEGADLVTGLSRTGPMLVDYRIADLDRHRRDTIEERVGALRREAEAEIFRRTLRAAEGRARRLRVAEIQVAERASDGSAGFAPVDRASGTGFAPIRVVAPSPFGR